MKTGFLYRVCKRLVAHLSAATLEPFSVSSAACTPAALRALVASEQGEGAMPVWRRRPTHGPVQAPAQDRPVPLTGLCPSLVPFFPLTTRRGAGGKATAGPPLRPVRPTPSPGEAPGTCRDPWAAWSCSGSRQGPGISLLRAELPPPSCPPTPLRCAQLPPGIPVATAASWGGGLPPQTFPCLRARFETRFPCSQSLNTARAFSEVIRGPCVGPSGTPPTTLPVVQSSWTQTRRGLRGGVFRGARGR